MDRLEDALRVIKDLTPKLTPEELTRVIERLGETTKHVRRQKQQINKKLKTPSLSGPAAVIQQLDNSFQTIEDHIGKGFPEGVSVTDVLAHDVADAHRTPMKQARGALANLYLASAHDMCDVFRKDGKKIRKTRLETLFASRPGDTSFAGTVKYFIDVNRLDHIPHIEHGLSKVGYRLLYLLRSHELDWDFLGLLLFCIGPLSRVKLEQLGELHKLLEKYRGFATKNRGWFRKWLASYEGIVPEHFFSTSELTRRS